MKNLRTYRSSLPASASYITFNVIAAFADLYNAISSALTTYNSYTETSLPPGMGGILTREEFFSLDASALQEMADQISQICQILNIADDDAASFAWSRELIEKRRAELLLDEGQLVALESIATILKSMLMPRRE
jgi:hypothetical protein